MVAAGVVPRSPLSQVLPWSLKSASVWFSLRIAWLPVGSDMKWCRCARPRGGPGLWTHASGQCAVHRQHPSPLRASLQARLERSSHSFRVSGWLVGD